MTETISSKVQQQILQRPRHMSHDRFAIVEVPPGTASPENSLLVAPLDLLMQYIPDTHARNDSIRRLENAQLRHDEVEGLQERTRAVQASILADSVQQLTRRLDAFVSRRAEQARRDAQEAEQREQEEIQAELDALPDPDNPTTCDTPPSPAGDLHDLPPSPSTLAQDQGSLPNKLLEGAPSETGTEPEPEAAEVGKAPNPPNQPTAISLW